MALASVGPLALTAVTRWTAGYVSTLVQWRINMMTDYCFSMTPEGLGFFYIASTLCMHLCLFICLDTACILYGGIRV